MNGRERIGCFFRREPADRLAVFEHFWDDTVDKYAAEGHMRQGEPAEEHFNLDIMLCWAFNFVLDLDFEEVVVEETDDTILTRNGSGALLRRHKKHSATPENVDYSIKERANWERVKHFITNIDERRIDFEGYRAKKARAKETGKFFMWSGCNVFELIHPICGHEHMLFGMADDPEWFADMARAFTDAQLTLQEILFAKEGAPDGVWYYEDLGFKQRPFISPKMYRELLMPSHKRSFDFAHERGLPVAVHSCGFIEPLLPYMVEAGMDCLQVIEVKAGMDLLRIYKEYGERLSLMGGVDVRALYTNDRAVIDAELEAKIPVVKRGNGYCLHSDHSIPHTVHYETLKYFHEKALSL
jgi:uroporphyrinogen decarboxylase